MLEIPTNLWLMGFILGMGGLAVMALNAAVKILTLFIDLTGRLKNLIEVTYHATHSQEFSDELKEEITKGDEQMD